MKNIIQYTIRFNRKQKTYTIRKYMNGKLESKYRSFPQGNTYSENWTENDIKNFLKTDEYYVVR